MVLENRYAIPKRVARLDEKKNRTDGEHFIEFLSIEYFLQFARSYEHFNQNKKKYPIFWV